MRIISFIVVACGILFLPVWAFALLACVYALLFTPFELLPLAMLVDAQFGDTTRTVWFLYTLIVSVILLLTVYVKPYLRFYQ